MVDDEGKKEEDKVEFDSAGEAVGYISLDQARVLAIRHARDHTEFYGRRYARLTLVWEVISQEETEDYYDIRLSFRPAGRFRGEPGVEQFIIDKTGAIELRQILDEPSELDAPRKRPPALLLAAAGLAAIAAIVGGVVFAIGGSGGDEGTETPALAVATPTTSSAITPPLTSAPAPTAAPARPAAPAVAAATLIRPAPSPLQELETVQTAIATYVSGNNMTNLPVGDVPRNSTNNFSAGDGQLNLTGYLRATTTIYYYCWDATGRITKQEANPIPCASLQASATLATPTPVPTKSTSVPPTDTSVPSDIENFTHLDLTILVGTTVTWINQDTIPHTSTAGVPSNPDPNQWDSGNILPNRTFTFTFNNTGTFAYFCRIHPDLMRATVTVLPTATPTPTPTVGPQGRIAFHSFRDGNWDIYVMSADGSGQTNLTNNSDHDSSPSWSPDGTKIAFSSSRDGKDDIYVMSADGSGVTRLTDNPAGDYEPSWSPDGAKIAFFSLRDGNREIYVMSADGSNQTRLTNNPTHDYLPSWSPDGAKIAFSSLRDGNLEIYVMNADGSGQTRLTNNPAGDYETSWSPDGTKIAFESERDGNAEIYVMDSDGSNVKKVTDNAAADRQPSWGP